MKKTLEQVTRYMTVDRKELVLNVLLQLGYDVSKDLSDDEQDELDGLLEDITSSSADAGWSGFTYYDDTVEFYLDNRKAINAWLSEMAEEIGQPLFDMIRSFGCLNDCKWSDEELGESLYGKIDSSDALTNSFAWFALEETARLFIN